MTRARRGLFAVAFACGILIGASVAVVGVTTYVECRESHVLGYSGTVETVLWLTVAPPGGFANYTEWTQRTTQVNGSTITDGGGFYGWTNGSAAIVATTNWTMYAVSSVKVAGFGLSAACPAYLLTQAPAAGGPFGGCSGCPITPPVPAGIDSRSTLPSNFTIDGVP